MNSAQAFWLRKPGTGDICPVELEPMTHDQVQVRSLYSGISRGTESLVFNGHVPVSQYCSMRAPFQDGDFPAPLKYGYNNVGLVEHGPRELCGREVFCLYPHQDRYRVPIASVTPLPCALPAGRAVLAANMETAVNAMWDLAPLVGDRISVVGAGTLGCLLAYLAARIPGTEVELVDINPARATIAKNLGVAFATPAQAASGRDQVVHTSASSSGLNTALSLAGFEATVLELSWYGDQVVAAQLGANFHSQRLKLLSSQVGAIATARREQRNHRQRMQLALQLLCDDSLDVLITGEDSFKNLPKVMAQLANGTLDAICHRIVYP